jgi:hypothetical protein
MWRENKERHMADRKSTKMRLKYAKYRSREISEGRVPDSYDVWMSKKGPGKAGASAGAGAIAKGKGKRSY